MIGGVVGEDPVERVVRKFIAAVIKNRLDGRAGKEPHRLAHRHAREEVTKPGTKSVQSKTFDRMVVQSAVSIWDVKTVVT